MSQKEIITMTKQELERLTIVNNLIKGIINGTEASKQLRLSVRQVKRIKARVIKLGSKGVIHKSRGRQGNRKFSQDFKDKVGRLLKTKYYYFTPLMATEHLLVEYNVKLSKETIRKWMTEQGLWKVKQRKQREVYRSQRKRKDHYGEMQQFDGSYHKWIHGLDEEQCLLASIDDATGKITHAHFEKNEGVIAVFKFWKKYIEINGKPLSIYLDKFSTYKVNHKNAEDNKDLITQFERATQELDITLIRANSPQAKGRIERLWKTLQTRLIIEMRHQKIKNVKEANLFLKKVFILWFNSIHAVVPKSKADLHRDNRLDLAEVFSIKKERYVGNDFVVRYKNKYYQLKEEQPVTVLKKSKVIVETSIEGGIRVRQKGKYLNFFVLPSKPKKEIEARCIALTRKKSSWKPPQDHPWRRWRNKVEK
jgi:hypothetical protein